MEPHNMKDATRLLEESLTRAEAWYSQSIEASTSLRMRQTATRLRDRVRQLKRYIHTAIWARREELHYELASFRNPSRVCARAVSRLVQQDPESATRMRELTADFARLMSEALSLLRDAAPSPHAVAVFNGSRKRLRALTNDRRGDLRR